MKLKKKKNKTEGTESKMINKNENIENIILRTPQCVLIILNYIYYARWATISLNNFGS